MSAPVLEKTSSAGRTGEPLLVAESLSKTFGNGVKAVTDVSLTVHRGQTLGVVGESGCGKSTTAKMLLGLLNPDAGSVHFAGVSMKGLRGKKMRELRARLQVVPQNPQTSLNPRLSVGTSIAFNLRVHGVGAKARETRVGELLYQVGLSRAHAERFPHEMSGGQLQRVAIARALATNPDLVICDEAVSALDKSVQAQVLNLLSDLQRELGIAYLFISHDLGVVEHVSDRVAVMYLGRVVEESTSHDLWTNPQHPYTQALLSATPGRGRTRIVLSGDPPNPAKPPTGCGFRTRCPVALDVCATEWPAFAEVAEGHLVSCVHAAPREGAGSSSVVLSHLPATPH